MSLQWDDSLSIGLSEIDNQHKVLITRVNELATACKQGKGKEAVGQTLAFLETYVIEHFKTEERLQKAAGYPEYVNHKSIHSKFLLSVEELKKQFNAQGPTLSFTIAMNKTLVDWLTNHIKAEDMKFGKFIRGS